MAASVARQQPATSMMARVDRLDLLLGYLEEMLLHRKEEEEDQHQHAVALAAAASTTSSSPATDATTCTASSPASTPASTSRATAAAGGGGLYHHHLVISDDADSYRSAASTPRGSKTYWRGGAASSCRPAKEVLEEAQTKGSLVNRIAFLEHRVLKMEEGMHMDMEITPAAADTRKEKVDYHHPSSNKKKRGLKSLVKSCVRGNLNTKE